MTTGSASGIESPSHAGKKNSVRKGCTKDLDYPLKLLAASTLGACGYYCRLNVIVSATNEKGLSNITDIDTLAIRYDLTFKPHLIAISCKSGTNFNVAHEIFYLRGVLDYIGNGEGLILSQHKTIPLHLRNHASKLGISGLNGPQIEEWKKSLSKDYSDPGYFDSARHSEYLKDMKNVLPGNSLLPFLNADFWYFNDYRNIQNLIAHFRRIENQLDGRNRAHTILFIEAAAHFCLAMFDLCRHINQMGTERIRDVLSPYLFGGSMPYKWRHDLYQKIDKIFASTGILPQGGLPTMEPPYTKNLAELVLTFTQRPQAAILVPLLLQDKLWQTLGASGSENLQNNPTYIAAHKLMTDLIAFMKLCGGHSWAPDL